MQLADIVQYLPSCLFVECACRLVQKQNLRLFGKRTGDRHSLLLSARTVSYTHLDVYKRQTAPIACDGFTVEMPLITLGLWLDGSIVSPIAGRRRGGSHPPVIADCFSLPAMQIVARPLMWLMLSQWQ